jgi:hypothetical protein
LVITKTIHLLEILHYEVSATNEQYELEKDIIDTEHFHCELVEFRILQLDSLQSLHHSDIEEEVQSEGEVRKKDVPYNS